jgi:hypothetical protein
VLRYEDRATVTRAEPQPPRRPAPVATGGPRKQALCVGINAYPTNALSGCVADAQEWAEVLGDLGFEVTMLLDGEATRARMLEAIGDLVATTGPGDVGVLQYSGHGTQVADADGDETDRLDEALVPVDFDDGAFLVDDDLRSIFATIPTGANLTCFMDCCFSESNTRMLRLEQPRRVSSAATARFLPRSPERDRLHREYRRARRSRGGPAPAAAEGSPITHVSFSACRDFQVALESGGHGHFTTAAATLLRDPDVLAWTNVELFQRILGTIEPGQTPTLEPAGDSRRVLAAYATASATAGGLAVPGPRGPSPNGRGAGRRPVAT